MIIPAANRLVHHAAPPLRRFLPPARWRLHRAGRFAGQNPSYLSERFPTEVRATASGFCYHQGAIWAGFTGPLLALFAATQPLGFAVPMLVSTVGAVLVVVGRLFHRNAGTRCAVQEPLEVKAGELIISVSPNMRCKGSHRSGIACFQ